MLSLTGCEIILPFKRHNMEMSSQEIQLQVMRAIELNPRLTQRQLAEVLGVSLGKAHYCMKALIDKGWVKMGNFSHNQKKLDYAYLLTPKGIKSKAVLTTHFLQRKMMEYEALRQEIELVSAKPEVKKRALGGA
ncbi:MarR family EPS-associated transcriptional regulator [Polynucleobacter sphagniphilus]|uniref:MarR family EPS-associated transcriptional regulator n=1 Tax=Polynucleobacter sphagniphilus TaxID=1743169 RepID=UPI0024063B88|nr:MarR family EPS-associated transcriptional regulator [Polynucleobacter sphagniphilus]MDF9787829.1 EPS-associated MarR family transcriptional regulator [Polynucleobacter sphagniphilus]